MRRKKLVNELKRHGLTVRSTSRGHLMVYGGGRRLTCFGGSPSDVRADRNALADLRRAGFGDIKPA